MLYKIINPLYTNDSKRSTLENSVDPDEMPHNSGCNDTVTSRYNTYHDICLTIQYVSRYIFDNLKTIEKITQIYEIMRSKYSNINPCQVVCFYVLHSSPVFIKFI